VKINVIRVTIKVYIGKCDETSEKYLIRGNIHKQNDEKLENIMVKCGTKKKKDNFYTNKYKMSVVYL